MPVNFVTFLLKIITITVAILFIVLIFVALIMETSRVYEFISGYATSLFLFCLSVLALSLSQKRALTTFLSVVIGGMFVRLLLFGVIVFLIYQFSEIDIHYYIGSFVVFYIIFQYFEIKLIQRTLIQNKK